MTGHLKELSIHPSDAATSALEPAAADSSRLRFMHIYSARDERKPWIFVCWMGISIPRQNWECIVTQHHKASMYLQQRVKGRGNVWGFYL